MKKLKSLRAFTAVALTLAFAIACTKKRDAELPYGADRELIAIDSYEGKEFDLQTMELLKPANTGAQIKVKDDREDGKAKVRNFDYVAYKANDPLKLTDDTLMLGRPQFKYKLRYVFEGNLLKVMKVAKAEDLASDEVAVAVDAGQDLLMVPIVSYNVSYFSIDTARNERNEKTSKLELIPQQGRSGSSHFKVDMNTKTRATFVSKTTVLPADFFDGANGDSKDWYFALTIVGQNFNEGRESLGAMISADKYGKEANKVRAKKVEDKIIFYNLAIDKDLQKSLDARDENQSTVITLPVDFIDYRFAENGKTSSVKEESHKERAWDKRSYMEIKIKDIKLPGQNGDLGVAEIKDVQLDEGYFSFTVHSEAVGGLVRFAFYNVKAHQAKMAKQGAQPYKPKIYFPEDHKLFGFFTTTQEIMSYYDSSKQELDNRKTLINRFNPTRKEIEFRLNQDAPEWTEEPVIKAAAGWNATFKAAGSQIRIRVTDEKGKVLRGQPGDLRYSLINMYHDVDAAGPWGGFGPVLQDPHTGEIIMATANMNLTDRIEGIKSTLNAYILSRKGVLDTKYILGLPFPSLKPVVDLANKTIQMVGQKLGISGSKNLAVYDPINRTFVKNLKPVVPAGAKKMTLANHAQFENRFDLINGNISAQVAEVCPELKTYADSLKTSQSDFEKEMKLVNDCAIQISKPVILTVLLHEMGHNMGLRHNFYGSADVRNFYAPVDVKIGNKTVKTQWVSSSVMDYVPMNNENMTQPGLYDIAAIRWGYTDQVETTDGKLATANPAAPTTVQMKTGMKKYMYCTDEDTDVVIRDPLCARSDIGTNPVEIVSNLILQFDSSIALSNNRNGRAHPRDMTTLAMYRYQDYLQPMKRFYEQWRNILAAQAGPGNEYLESFEDPAKYKALVETVLDPKKVGAQQAERNLQYKKASDLIFNFLLRVAFLPDYSCIADRTVNGNSTAQMFSFSRIQKTIFNSTGHTVQSCSDPEVKAYLKEKKQADVIFEGGYSFENLYADLSGKEVGTNYQPVDKPEVTGLALDRYLALLTLVDRTNVMYLSQSNQFMPNFVDELPYRTALNEKLMSRLTKGVAIQDVGLDKALKQQLPELISPSFEVEKPLLGEMVSMLKFGLQIPGKSVVTNKRLEKFALVPMYALRGDEDYVCIPVEGYNYCATDLHSESKKLLKQLQQLDAMKGALKISDTAVAKFLELTTDLVPPKGKGAQLDITFLDKLKERVEAVQSQDAALYSELNILANNVFGLEAQLWNIGVDKKLKKIDEADLSKKEAQERVEKLKKIKLKELVEKLGLTEKEYQSLDQEVLKKRVETFVQNIRAAAAAYEADPTELDAQADLILNAIMGR